MKTEIITPNDNFHYFFGYYDMIATKEENPYHLCHRVAFMDRLPESDDICEIGYIKDGEFKKIAQTTAWNFQQGAMLQYHPTKKDTVCYNVCENGVFKTVTHNFVTGEKKHTDKPIACLSPDGKWGLSVNFGRIFKFRPGYGYAGYKDEFENENAPHNDGVFLIDMETGVSKQIVFYDSLAKTAGFDEDEKIMINHITFNTSSDRYVMLVRNFSKFWKTSMVIGDLKGNVKTVIRKNYVSHYYWTSADEILAHCETEKSGRGLLKINVDSGDFVKYEMLSDSQDIHCILSPDKRFIIGDGYPIDGKRPLLCYDLQKKEARVILSSKSVAPDIIDIRCDLHARFINGGKYISYDTTENDRREIAVVPISILE